MSCLGAASASTTTATSADNSGAWTLLSIISKTPLNQKRMMMSESNLCYAHLIAAMEQNNLVGPGFKIGPDVYDPSYSRNW